MTADAILVGAIALGAALLGAAIMAMGQRAGADDTTYLLIRKDDDR